MTAINFIACCYDKLALKLKLGIFSSPMEVESYVK